MLKQFVTTLFSTASGLLVTLEERGEGAVENVWFATSVWGDSWGICLTGPQVSIWMCIMCCMFIQKT